MPVLVQEVSPGVFAEVGQYVLKQQDISVTREVAFPDNTVKSVEHTYQDTLTIPVGSVMAWTDEERAAAGLYLVDVPDAPAGKIVTSVTFERVKDTVQAVLTMDDRAIDEVRAERKAAVSARRWDIENGGIMIDKSVIRTDAISQGKIAGACAGVNQDPTVKGIDWEAQPGDWVTVDRTAMIKIGMAVFGHVQACFSNARRLHEQIDKAGSVDEVLAVDIETGWPA